MQLPNKTSLLQECRAFHEANPSTKQVTGLLTKLIQSICAGEQLTQNELQEVFFAATKLFTMRDHHVRRLLSLLISLLAPGTESAFIITSCLLKDLNSPVAELKSTAFRVLARIMDPSLAPNVSRQTRESLSDPHPSIQASAFLCAQSMLPFSFDTVSRWTKESFSVLKKSVDASVQLQCISFISKATEHDLKSHVQSLSSIVEVRSKLATIPALLLTALIGSVLRRMPQPQRPPSFLSFLTDETKSTSHSVSIGACRELVSLSDCPPSILMEVQSSLKYSLTSSMSLPVQKLAAVRTIELLSSKGYDLGTIFSSLSLEGLEGKTLTALTLSIKFQSNLTAAEATTELRKLSRFLRSLGSDSLRIKVLEAIKKMPLRNADLAEPVLSFVGSLLREEGTQKLKSCLFDVVKSVAETHRCDLAVADFLSELIEDCEYTSIAVDSIELLCDVADVNKDTSLKYVRSLINRILLENTVVRCAALRSLGRLFIEIEDQSGVLYAEILKVFKMALVDSEDEVRELAIFITQNIEQQKGKDFLVENRLIDDDNIEINGQHVSLSKLTLLLKSRRELVNQGETPSSSLQELLNEALSSVSAVSSPSPKGRPVLRKQVGKAPVLDKSLLPADVTDLIQSEMIAVGSCLISEDGMEYTVTVDKFCSQDFSNIFGQVFVSPKVIFTPETDDFTVHQIISTSADVIPCESDVSTYSLFTANTSSLPHVLSLRFSAMLHYGLADADEEDPSSYQEPIMEEEAELDFVSFEISDFAIPSFVDPSVSWTDPECRETLTEALKLPHSNAAAGLDALSGLFGCDPGFKSESGNVIRAGWDFDLIDDSRILIRCEVGGGDEVVAKIKMKSSSDELLGVVSQLFSNRKLKFVKMFVDDNKLY
ncbi:hypothetical protein GEMRC1_008820 [Eukaryota sp. GEM-RC1]